MAGGRGPTDGGRTAFLRAAIPPRPLEADRGNPALAIMAIASLDHLIAFIFFAPLGLSPAATPLGKLVLGTQLVFCLMAAAAAYRVWEDEANGLALFAIPLGIVAILLLAIVGMAGAPIIVGLVCFAPAALDIAAGVVEIAQDRSIETRRPSPARH